MRTLIVTALTLSVLATSCSSAPSRPSGPPRPWDRAAKDSSMKQKRFEALGTDVTVRVWTAPGMREPIKTVFMDAVNEIQRISALCDPGEPDAEEGGDVFRINKGAGNDWVKVAPETMEMVKLGQAMYARSGGVFNISYRKGVAPESKQGLDLDINERDSTVKLTTIITRINLYGLARGYAVNRAMLKLRGRGLAGFMISAGGFMMASGKPLSMPGLICIEDPHQLSKCAFPVQALQDPLIMGVSASEERKGNMYHPSELWTYRSGGVTVTGNSGPWVQFGSTVSAIMPDAQLEAFFGRGGNPPLNGAYYQLDGMLHGGLEPFARVGKPGQVPK